MAATTVSFEEFQKDADRVDEASVNGPVFVTRPGRKTLVVLDIEEYQKLAGKELRQPNILELLAYPGAGAIEFEPPRMGTEVYTPVDLFE
jgi:PHD/YefM family antitoxin component YafN of YafNO toxin-antitoxin module